MEQTERDLLREDQEGFIIKVRDDLFTQYANAVSGLKKPEEVISEIADYAREKRVNGLLSLFLDRIGIPKVIDGKTLSRDQRSEIFKLEFRSRMLHFTNFLVEEGPKEAFVVMSFTDSGTEVKGVISARSRVDAESKAFRKYGFSGVSVVQAPFILA